MASFSVLDADKPVVVQLADNRTRNVRRAAAVTGAALGAFVGLQGVRWGLERRGSTGNRSVAQLGAALDKLPRIPAVVGIPGAALAYYLGFHAAQFLDEGQYKQLRAQVLQISSSSQRALSIDFSAYSAESNSATAFVLEPQAPLEVTEDSLLASGKWRKSMADASAALTAPPAQKSTAAAAVGHLETPWGKLLETVQRAGIKNIVLVVTPRELRRCVSEEARTRLPRAWRDDASSLLTAFPPSSGASSSKTLLFQPEKLFRDEERLPLLWLLTGLVGCHEGNPDAERGVLGHFTSSKPALCDQLLECGALTATEVIALHDLRSDVLRASDDACNSYLALYREALDRTRDARASYQNQVYYTTAATTLLDAVTVAKEEREFDKALDNARQDRDNRRKTLSAAGRPTTSADAMYDAALLAAERERGSSKLTAVSALAQIASDITLANAKKEYLRIWEVTLESIAYQRRRREIERHRASVQRDIVSRFARFCADLLASEHSIADSVIPEGWTAPPFSSPSSAASAAMPRSNL